MSEISVILLEKREWTPLLSTQFSSIFDILNLVHTSAPLTRCVIRMQHVFGARLINFPRTWGEQRTSGAWIGHTSHPVLFVFMQKTEKQRSHGNLLFFHFLSIVDQSSTDKKLLIKNKHIFFFFVQGVYFPFSVLKSVKS